MPHTISSETDRTELADHILNEIDELVRQADQSGDPLEVDPARSRLFELFVTAEGAGYLAEDSDPDLSADGLCASLSELWGLKAAAMESTANQSRLPPQQLSKMRLLWSLMRMWMEWTYAWSRWDEFHREPTTGSSPG